MDDLIDQIKRGGIQLKQTRGNFLRKTHSEAGAEPSRPPARSQAKKPSNAVQEMKNILATMKRSRSGRLKPSSVSQESRARAKKDAAKSQPPEDVNGEAPPEVPSLGGSKEDLKEEESRVQDDEVSLQQEGPQREDSSKSSDRSQELDVLDSENGEEARDDEENEDDYTSEEDTKTSSFKISTDDISGKVISSTTIFLSKCENDSD